MDPAAVQANRSAQAEELEALRYIYADDIVVHEHEHFCEISVYPSHEDSSSSSLSARLKLDIFFPDEYPSHGEPIFEFGAAWLSDQDQVKLEGGFHDLYSSSGAQVIVFKWIEWMKEQDWLWNGEKRTALANHADDPTSITLTDKRLEDVVAASSESFEPIEKHGDLLPVELDFEELDKLHGIVHGSPFTEKRSTFQAHLAPVRSLDQVEAVMETLNRNRKIAGATHNIMAFRIVLPDRNTVLQDHDDDGESAAGHRLLHLLQIVDAIDVVVVVSRWFGGILLGPDRFKHINNAARSLLESCGYVRGDSRKSSSPSSSKKGKAR